MTRRLSPTQFKFRKHCIFCSKSARYNRGKSEYDVIIAVKAKDFKDSTSISISICFKRKDRWAEKVKGRLQYAQDLHAADAVYHNQCSIHFLTIKQLPKELSDDSKRQKCRPDLCLEI